MARNPGRPLSPHLTIWKWGPAMLVSILHRATGTALAIGGGIIFVWWLAAAAGGPESYATFSHWIYHADRMRVTADLATLVNVLARLAAIAFTWAFFQHMFSGLRHFVLDTGAGYELKTNKTWSIATIIGSVVVTVALLPIILKGVI
ncbi:succinate dehydrogenase, cytochrome b556 subunit [Sphingomonas naphthae]|uniref:Succinate dehydrogenase cytochrome b556 subunit n=1 Tax=Sphingomonas naphthae TaxID=1813468 RepID=A0ABY7TJ70_9SPHN|nr:succinate dehydrogenase, cytochrome b556 subunit [Sphingomonas naphthae]WCT72996.1 succinate dehydrogenase, cytochrome b556 subunit [Sphingomonas naphthae]